MKRITLTLLCCMVLISGCEREKKAIKTARKALEVAAQTVQLVDEQTADLYTEASLSALEACGTRVCYETEMARWDKMVKASVAMKRSLLTVEIALDAWEAGSPNGSADIRRAAGCFIGAMLELESLIQGLGAEVQGLGIGIQHGKDLFGLTGEECV